jgi:N-acetylmuramate 1-kinase
MSPNTALIWADPQRQQLFEAWLASVAPQQKLAPQSVELASSDASFRRYLRVRTHEGASRVIMDAPPDKENCEPFVKVAALMHGAGVACPEVLEWDRENGFMLLTDLGQDTLMQHFAKQGARVGEFWVEPENPAFLPWFKQSIDMLVKWQLASKPEVLPAYDDALLSRELALFPDWYWARHKGVDLSQPEHADKKRVLDEMFALIKGRVLQAPSVFVHRDFMPRNLMVAANGQSLGVLDFQDAVYGPITYDIASLMRDAFLSWDEEFVMDVTIRYWSAAKKAGLIENGPWGDWADDFGSFYAGVEWMGLQRHLKVAGIFARLTLRDGKPQYLADAPRFIQYIRHACNRYGALKPLLRLIDEVEGIESVSGIQYGR